MDDKKISTTQLAKLAKLESRELFDLLADSHWIKRSDDEEKSRWLLTAKGEFEGGEYFTSSKFGTYIVWPKMVLEHAILTERKAKLLTATALGKDHNLPARLVNHVLLELGLIAKHINGWQLTVQGKALGGIEQEHRNSGVIYALWPESMAANQHWLASVKALDLASFNSNQDCKTLDGHRVDNAQLAIISNWLYVSGLAYAYQRQLPVMDSATQVELYSDFYLPSANVYIEYWNASTSPDYLAAKFDKIEQFNQLQTPMIELTQADVEHLDDVLPRLLLKYGIKVY
jgi:hypothetical protein